MYSVANFEISLTALDSEKDKIAEFLAVRLNGQETGRLAELRLARMLKYQANGFCVEGWPATSFHVEELAIALAQFILRNTYNASFTMEGGINNDYTSSDFAIAYANGTLSMGSNEDNEYDVYMIDDQCPDYEEFCDRFWDEDNDCPMYTEEEYEEFCTWEPAFVLDDGRILEYPPDIGASKKYKITPNSVIPESSDDDWEDDEDFEEDDD